MLVVIDNYDSFTYNLVQYLGELGQDIVVFRNDKCTIKDIEAKRPNHIVISPGPGRPSDAGVSADVVRHFYKKVPILGVCLGHQVISEIFGGKITYAPTLMHGKTSDVKHYGKTVFCNIPNPFVATRYHSLVLDPETMPDELELTAQTDDGVIMGVRHKKYPLEGIQFHPESILTENGKDILRNFLDLV